MSKDHAEHNEKLCLLLIGNKNFNDWVITTAFYSSLHFVLSKIFPLTITGITFNNIDRYYKSLPRFTKPSKHKVILKLVSSYIPMINSEYRWLFDACTTARYHEYKISEPKANKAKDYMDRIKSHC